MKLMNPLFYLKRAWYMQRVNSALSRAAVTSALRRIDPTTPSTWEFSGFSQNGEDGILDYLSRHLLKENRYFLEIGTGDGIENNSAWFAIARKYGGVMIEGNPEKSLWNDIIVSGINVGVECHNLFISLDSVTNASELLLHKDPDIFSLDIDGNDYYIAKALLDLEIRPKILVVEYNSVYGPTKSITIRYNDRFNFVEAHESQLYFGASISGWKKLLKRFGYKFVTVDQNGVNAFFIDPNHFEERFVSRINGLEYKDNFYQMRQYKMLWQDRFKIIQDMDYIQIE